MSIVKTKKEIETLKAAAAIGSEVFLRILPQLVPGATEKGLAARMTALAKELGADDLSFPPIIASGKNGAQPHAVPTNRMLRKGDFVTIDFGVTKDGFCSDMTRTFFVAGGKASGGKGAPRRPTAKQARIYDIVLTAQLAGIEAARPGMACKDLDAVCRGIIEQAGFGRYFIHTTGHGVGTEIHEDPRIGKKSDAVLEAGMVVTIEPGVYIGGWGGVRIEDTVVITEEGCEVITLGVGKSLL
ncbi:MAG: aminopeptidase P family protein [Clostridiales Family XIII bacterium]|jgi:Xaa-Pro aminopeptidase/Xaa-Pro dipeptidase|nr:aminopeptidase P family protein [Clostridiales Family XIII bacterium]